MTGFICMALVAFSLKTVVIDPGHGGKDPGCVSRDGKTYEKTITLDISKRFAEKISAAYPEVKVIMTRTEDVYVTLADRADIANKADADLFVSIHVNSIDKGTAANGYSIHCLGQSSRKGNDLFSKNLDLCRRENSVITLEDNYKSTYKGFDPSDPKSYILFSLMQNAHLENSLRFAEDIADAMKGGPIKTNRGVSQDPFLVLWRTTMPSVLIETGFMSNPDDLAALKSEAECDEIASRLLQAFSVFKTRYDSSMGSGTAPEAPKAEAESKTAPEEAKAPEAQATETTAPKEAGAKPATEESKVAGSESKPASGVVYGTQVLATSRRMDSKDSYFQGYEPMELPAGKLYKYIIGTGDEKIAREKNKKIIKYFPDSFLVRIDGEKVERIR